MINVAKFESGETLVYNEYYRVSCFFYKDVNKASLCFNYLTSDSPIPILMLYVDVTSPRQAFKVASACLRGWTKQRLESGWTGVLDLPAPNKLPGAHAGYMGR